MEHQAGIMKMHLDLLETLMWGLPEAPACKACLRLTRDKASRKAYNFYTPTQHILSTIHIQALPTMLPKEHELDDYWQVIEHPEGHFAFNHVTLQVIPPGEVLMGPVVAPLLALPAPAIPLPNA